MVIETRTISAEGDGLAIDPFLFWPDYASRFKGLGGSQPHPDDPDYAFHTPYVACGDGRIRFRVTIEGLRAERGTLLLRINEFPTGVGARARRIAVGQFQLADLARGGGSAEIVAHSRTGNTYAVIGHVYGDADVAADAIVAAIEHIEPLDDAGGGSPLRSAPLVRSPRIIAQGVPTLGAPVSQTCTGAQLLEPLFREWRRRLSPGMSDLGAWESAFVGQAAIAYGFAAPGASGVLVGDMDPGLIEHLIGLRCSFAIQSADDFMGLDQRGQFDFCLSTSHIGLAGDASTAFAFQEKVLVALRPDGLAVSSWTFDPALGSAPYAAGSEIVLTAQDVQRSTLTLLSRGHLVAQLKFGDTVVSEPRTDDTTDLTAIGLITKRTRQ